MCTFSFDLIYHTVESFLFDGGQCLSMDYQHFTGSVGRNFVGNWFIVLQLWGHECVDKGNLRNPRSNMIPSYLLFFFKG